MTTTHPPAPHSTRPARGRRWRAAMAASVLAIAPLGLVACGGDGSDSAGAAGSGGATASSTDLQAFQECLAEHGVEMGAPPDQRGDAEGAQPTMPDQDAMQEAQEACADLAPEGMGRGGPGMGAGGGEDLQAYTECLAEHGVEVATPGEGAGQPPSGEPPAAGDGSSGQPSGSPFGLDTSDPEVAAAAEACADLEPTMPSGGPDRSGSQDGADSSGDGATQSS